MLAYCSKFPKLYRHCLQYYHHGCVHANQFPNTWLSYTACVYRRVMHQAQVLLVCLLVHHAFRASGAYIFRQPSIGYVAQLPQSGDVTSLPLLPGPHLYTYMHTWNMYSATRQLACSCEYSSVELLGHVEFASSIFSQQYCSLAHTQEGHLQEYSKAFSTDFPPNFMATCKMLVALVKCPQSGREDSNATSAYTEAELGGPVTWINALA